MKIHFISFSSPKFIKTLYRLEKEANASNFFDTVNCLTTSDLPIDYKISNIFILNKFTRGYGYWIWKSYITKKYLDKIAFGDILVYADAGCVINAHAFERFNEYLYLLSSSNRSSISFQTTHLECKYTKGDVLYHLNVTGNSEILNTGQLIAGIYLLKKNDSSISLIDKWFDICHNYTNLINDKKSFYPNDSAFINHKHDQSIFSILRKLEGTIELPDETYSIDWLNNQHVPILAKRLLF